MNRIKKWLLCVTTALAFCLFAACGAEEPVVPVALALPEEVVSAEVTLPDAEPVTLTGAELETLIQLLDSAEMTEDKIVAANYIADVVLLRAGGESASYLLHSCEDGSVVVSAPGGQLATIADVDALNTVLSSEAFRSMYTAQAPAILLVGDTDYSGSVSSSGTLRVVMPNGETVDSQISTQGAGTVELRRVSERMQLSFEQEPDELLIQAKRDGTLLFEGDAEQFAAFLPNSNGACTVTAQATWNEGGAAGFNGVCTYTFEVDCSLPMTIDLQSYTVAQGEPFVIYIRNAEQATVESELYHDARQFTTDGMIVVLIPTNYMTTVGDYELTVNATPAEGVPDEEPPEQSEPSSASSDSSEPESSESESSESDEASDSEESSVPEESESESESESSASNGLAVIKKIAVTVTETAFEVQRLTVDEELAESTVDNDVANWLYTVAANAVNEEYDERLYFNEPFIQPAEGEVTADFGMTRYVNGELSTRHAAVDFAAEENSPVAAANAGRVVYADFLDLTGNTVVIEHGYGIKTWYYHMNELDVSVGDIVERGQTIGKVGSTGFSTGPHLHFACSIDGRYISPWYVIGNQFIDVHFREQR